MPTQRQRDGLLQALVRQWAGTEPPRAWTAGDVAAVWPALAAHGVEAPLGGCLPAGLPGEAHRAALAAARERTGLLLMELERILPAVRAAGVEPLVLKGAGLALSAYADPLDRWFVDLDLLVPPSGVEATCAALEQAGYRPFPDRSDWAYFDRHHLHRALLGPSGQVVEVHWALTPPASAYRFPTATVWSRARTVVLGRGACQVAGDPDQVVHALYQQVADGFVDLRRVLDLVLLARRMTPADWAATHALVLETGLERAWGLLLHIVKSMVLVDLPGVASPRRPLGPLAWRLLGNLDVPTGLLRRRATRVPGYDRFLFLVLLPTGSRRLRELGRMASASHTYRTGEHHPGHRAAEDLSRARSGLTTLARVAKVTLAALGASNLDAS